MSIDLSVLSLKTKCLDSKCNLKKPQFQLWLISPKVLGENRPQRKKRFLNIAQGSADECSYYLILAKDLKFISEPNSRELETLLDEVSCLLNIFNKAIE